MRRVNVAVFTRFIESRTDAEIEAQHRADEELHQRQYNAFLAAYKTESCYLCGLPFKTMSTDKPCVHWLLRRGKFKKKDFSRLFRRFGYTQMGALARWVANQERLFGNINDIEEGRDPRKIFQYTVRWRNVEWTFDCSRSDYEGHPGRQTDFPHFHLQMRLNDRPFIYFGDFHIPFTEEDLFRLDLSLHAPEYVNVSFGDGGLGMQATAELDPEVLMVESEVAEADEEATHRMSTMIRAESGPIDPQVLLRVVQESRQTGELIANVARKHFGESHNIQTVITVADSVPDIAKRTERKRR